MYIESWEQVGSGQARAQAARTSLLYTGNLILSGGQACEAEGPGGEEGPTSALPVGNSLVHGEAWVPHPDAGVRAPAAIPAACGACGSPLPFCVVLSFSCGKEMMMEPTLGPRTEPGT